MNQHSNVYSAEVRNYCREVARTCSAAEFSRHVDELKTLRVLIVGDIIFDRYTTVEVQGLTSKSSVLSGRFVADSIQAGGALAVYRHVREFSSHVKLISLVGSEPWLGETLGGFIPPNDADIIHSPEFTTIVKQRFVGPRTEGKELTKLFAVNFIDRCSPNDKLQRAVMERVAGHIENHDLVIAMDFGHGLLEDLVRNYVQDKARFISVNCQTNSNNHGFNILNRRYRRADSFTLDQTEIKLAVGRREFDFSAELGALAAALGSRYAWLTRGAIQTLGWQPTGKTSACSPFEQVVVDPLGAGDAFCAVVSLAACRGLPLEVATFMGQLAGAQAVRIVGNAEPIRKQKFLDAAVAMLSL